MSKTFDVVTGSFSFTGKYITRELLALGKSVATLTGHPDRPNPFKEEIKVLPFHFDNVDKLTEDLKGADTLYNTYWIRFSHKANTFEQAIENTKNLVKAAEKAGIRRLVHVSISNPSEDSDLPYFKGKAILEKVIKESGLSYAIVRPTLIFGLEDILINNIAWLLKKLPAFAIPGDGSYLVQPIFVEDYAKIAVEAGQKKENFVIDAVGPDIFTFDEMVKLIREKINSRAMILHQSPRLTYFFSKIISYLVNDVILTNDEVKGLMANLLISKDTPTGTTHLAKWLEENSPNVGQKYSSEIERHYK